MGTLQWNHFLNVEYIMSGIRKLFNSVDPSFLKFPIKNHSLNCCSEILEVTWKLLCQKFLIERLFCSKWTKLSMYSLVLSGSFLAKGLMTHGMFNTRNCDAGISTPGLRGVAFDAGAFEAWKIDAG